MKLVKSSASCVASDCTENAPAGLFSTLPRELRDEIYEILFPHKDIRGWRNQLIAFTGKLKYSHTDGYDSAKEAKIDQTAILRASKTIHAEAIVVLFRNTIFKLFALQQSPSSWRHNRAQSSLVSVRLPGEFFHYHGFQTTSFVHFNRIKTFTMALPLKYHLPSDSFYRQMAEWSAVGKRDDLSQIQCTIVVTLLCVEYIIAGDVVPEDDGMEMVESVMSMPKGLRLPVQAKDRISCQGSHR